MKLTKTTWMALVLGVLLIGGILLFTNLNQQSSQKQSMEKELALAKQKLVSVDNDQLIIKRDDLKNQFADLSNQSKDVKSKLRYPLDSISITDDIIQDAADCRVDLLEISTPGQGTESMGGIVFRAMNLTIRARGTTDTIADFVYSLKKVFPTGVIKSLTLDVIEPPKPPAVIVDNSTFNSENMLSSISTVIGTGSTSDKLNDPVKDKLVQIKLSIYNFSGE